jgi:hypothetical protein
MSTKDSIRRVAPTEGPQRELIDAVALLLYEGAIMEAGTMLAKWAKTRKPTRMLDAKLLCQSLVDWCLVRDHYADAAKLLWTPNMFSPEPRSTQMIWDAIDTNSCIFLMGASSMSKSYSSGVYFMLDWLRDPEYTTVTVIGPTEDHLNRNLFSHLTRLHREATIPLPGTIGELFIGVDRRDRRGGLSGVVMPRGPKAAGKLQGAKRFQRSRPHPQFGVQSRLRALLDEIENIPGSVWSDLDNLTSNIDAEPDAVEGLKIVGAFNPKDISGPVAKRAEPAKFWKNVDLEEDEVWTSARGWRVVRLDAEKAENVLEGRLIYPGLQTARGLDKLRESTGGVDSAGYLTFGRAMFPGESMYYSVVPTTSLMEWEGEYIWLEKPRRVCGIDLALEGGDAAVAALGYFGTAIGINLSKSPAHPAGRTVMFENNKGQSISRPALQLTHLRRLPKAPTMEMARNVKALCVEQGVMPQWIMLDRTGNGSGVHDVLRETWSPEVRGINYSESASQLKLVEEEADVAKVLYDRVYSELWFGLSKWFEFSLMKVHPSMDYRDDLYRQLIDRRYDPRVTCRVESKRDWKKRQSEDISPNEVDAVGLLLHAVRMEAKIVPSGLTTSSSGVYEEHELDSPLPCDVTNTFEEL